MATYPWARSHFWAGANVDGLDHLTRWLGRLHSHPAIQTALKLPWPRPSVFGEGDTEAAAAANAANYKE